MGGFSNATASTGATGREAWTPKGYKLRDKYKDASPAILAFTNMFTNKGEYGPRDRFFEKLPQRDSMKVHSFENSYVPNTTPSREYVAPEYQGEYKSLLSDWDQPKQMGSTAGFGDPNQYFRDSMSIDRGVKGATAKRRGGSGRARPSRAPTKTNQYTDTAQGTGLHT